MKKCMTVFVALALLAAGGAAWAATTTVAVSANVVGTCRFNSGGTIAFGSLDQSSGGDVSGTVTQPAFWCTKGSSYAITDDSGLHEVGPGPRRMTNGTDFIPYSVTYTASGTGAGKTAPTSMNIAATVLNVDYVGVSEGSYTDTITLTITP